RLFDDLAGFVSNMAIRTGEILSQETARLIAIASGGAYNGGLVSANGAPLGDFNVLAMARTKEGEGTPHGGCRAEERPNGIRKNKGKEGIKTRLVRNCPIRIAT